MYTDDKLLLQLIALLKAHNVSRIVISSGSRHFPLIHSLENDDFFKLYSVVDERSAAFFALGLIQKTNEPVGISCTSGSAITNYGSAVSEAFYQHLPLLLITADRIPELLGQLEDQMIEQKEMFKGFIKYNGNLPVIENSTDEWYANRIINEALIELNHHGKGPVQINYPIKEHSKDKFQTTHLPKVRKITLHTSEIDKNSWEHFSQKLIDKKILIVWGQSVPLSESLKNELNKFCERFNCVILTDKISNLHHPYAIENAFITLKALSLKEKEELFPDIVISIGGNIVFNNEIKSYLKTKQGAFENWQVGSGNKVIDPFRRLTEMFEMNESTFFSNITNINQQEKRASIDFFEKWEEVSEAIEEPNPAYSQLYAIGKLLKNLPDNSVLHLANSITIRMGHMFNFNHTVACYCNRGVNGIDGCMSTAVGYASESKELNFLIIGDLAFFYDMNALWNKHLQKNLRILLVNNEGGAVIHIPFDEETGKTLPSYASAGHKTSAKGWVESLGIKYMAAHNQEETDKGIELLIDKNEDGPILLEVFTKKENDVQVFKEYLSKINRITLNERVKRKTKSVISKILK
jgi:2-succinyl-5-enolpyruvyl-6-hydroxy-3-cyclohexene-1-carboxylate synthase